MRFAEPLVRGRFLSREKRFFVHAALDDGRVVVAHTNNTGSMRGTLAPAAPVWLSPAANPARKLRWTLELIETVDGTAAGVPPGVLVGVNTALANHLAAEAVAGGLVAGLETAGEPRREVRYGEQGSRIDLLYEPPGAPPAWVEVKNVSLVEHGHARFPDSPTARGRKHLQELMTVVQGGGQAFLVFCVQRGDARSAGPADDIDPAYGALLRQALAAGVQVRAVGMSVTPGGIGPDRALPLKSGIVAP